MMAFRLDEATSAPRGGRSMDPVCGMSVDPASAAGAWAHAGRTYFFCSARCLNRFKADPQHFVDLDPNERSMG
jgi:Cu+-exporting ATPase